MAVIFGGALDSRHGTVNNISITL
ncbi:hypothetical protein ARTHRO9AX_20218 [Arthrobacter sp. 9AX]|nr:hypothetical protein ARTHRO9AX_20218 [Arthrobacter sp. 9AX]